MIGITPAAAGYTSAGSAAPPSPQGEIYLLDCKPLKGFLLPRRSANPRSFFRRKTAAPPQARTHTRGSRTAAPSAPATRAEKEGSPARGELARSRSGLPLFRQLPPK